MCICSTYLYWGEQTILFCTTITTLMKDCWLQFEHLQYQYIPYMVPHTKDLPDHTALLQPSPKLPFSNLVMRLNQYVQWYIYLWNRHHKHMYTLFCTKHMRNMYIPVVMYAWIWIRTVIHCTCMYVPSIFHEKMWDNLRKWITFYCVWQIIWLVSMSELYIQMIYISYTFHSNL